MTGPVVCTRCLSAGPARKITPGSMLIELVLWLCLVVPGLVYSLWRLSARYTGCATCGAREVVPASSPAARQILGGVQ